MATMKDVAKLANVSHGTVSNIVNGTKRVSLDKIRRVEKAMQELSYKPNAIARNLKLNQTMQIDVILPRITMDSLARIFSTLSYIANENGYVANLYMTNEDAELETKLLNQSQMYNRDGVILMTCQPHNMRLFRKFLRSGPHIVFLEREVYNLEYDFVGINVKDVIRKGIGELLSNGYEAIGIIIGPIEYSFEKQCFRGYVDAHKNLDRQINDSYTATTNYDRESAFKEAVRILQQNKLPQAILVTCSQTEDAVRKAIEILGIEKDRQPLLIVLTSESWSSMEKENTLYLALPFDKLAETAFYLLYKRMNEIESSDKMERKLLDIDEMDFLSILPQNTPIQKKVPDKTLRVLLTRDSTQNAIRAFVSRFEQETGCRVEIDVKKYPDMYDTIRKQTESDYYDVLDLDIPWIGELAQEELIIPIDSYLEKESGIVDDFPENIFQKYCVYDGRVYGLPLTFCEQLLFYRKDYFDDLKTKRLFFTQYKRELTPPKTWQEYNETARFFTRAYNEMSPTEFGSTAGCQKYSGAVCEYLPRFWGYGGKIFENGRFCFDSKEAIAALHNYKETFLYAPYDSYDNWWEEQTADFRGGKAAMMILFGDNASTVTERDKSAIIGKIGYERIPGGIGVNGGWSLAINSKSRIKDAAFEFIKWACGKEYAYVNTILGGFVPRNSVINNLEIAKIYPWLRKTVEALDYSKQRSMPCKKDGSYVREPLFEKIVGEAVYNTVTRQAEVEESLFMANERLNAEYLK